MEGLSPAQRIWRRHGSPSLERGSHPAWPFRYVIVAPERAPVLLPTLERHFAGDARVAVLVERRSHEGGRQPDARAAVAIRDARLVLPLELRAHTDAIRYVQRLAPVRRTFECVAVHELLERCAYDPLAVSELWWRGHERALTRLRIHGAEAGDGAALSVFLGHVLDELDDFSAVGASFESWLDAIADRFAAG